MTTRRLIAREALVLLCVLTLPIRVLFGRDACASWCPEVRLTTARPRRRPFMRPALIRVRQGIARDVTARVRAALRRDRPALPAAQHLDRPGVSVCGCDPRTPGVLEVIGGRVTDEQLDRLADGWRGVRDGRIKTLIVNDGLSLRWRPFICTCGDRRRATTPESDHA